MFLCFSVSVFDDDYDNSNDNDNGTVTALTRRHEYGWPGDVRKSARGPAR